jgi:hypothetical protein
MDMLDIKLILLLHLHLLMEKQILLHRHLLLIN